MILRLRDIVEKQLPEAKDELKLKMSEVTAFDLKAFKNLIP